MPVYLLIKRRTVAELDSPSDLLARQYAQADRAIERVETDTGRVVYRRTREDMPDIDLSSFDAADEVKKAGRSRG